MMNDACEACFSHQAFYVTSLRPALVASPLPVNRTPIEGSGCWARAVRAGSLVMLLTDSPCPLSSIVCSLQRETINNFRFHQQKRKSNWSDICTLTDSYVLCVCRISPIAVTVLHKSPILSFQKMIWLQITTVEHLYQLTFPCIQVQLLIFKTRSATLRKRNSSNVFSMLTGWFEKKKKTSPVPHIQLSPFLLHPCFNYPDPWPMSS